MNLQYDCIPCPELCDGEVSGDFIQTLFLGLTVVNFTATVGWNEQVSDLTVNLRYDECDGDKVCYDDNLDYQVINVADPGFIALHTYLSAEDGTRYSSCVKRDPADFQEKVGVNILGAPVYFRFGDFEFAGLVSDWTEQNGSQGTEYRVKVVDPRLILEGVHLITGEFSGRIDKDFACSDIPAYNIFNVFGYMEQFGGVYCPPVTQTSQYVYNAGDYCDFFYGTEGAIFGSAVGFFGGAIRNERGMPLFRIIDGFNVLANSLIVTTDQTPFSGVGRIVYGSNPSNYNVGCGYMEPDNYINGYWMSEYFIDISELPDFNRSSYYRIDEDIISVSDLVSKVCSDAGCDFYWELIPIQDASFSNGIVKMIKLRTADRTVQQQLGKICEYVKDVECASATSIGGELRNEEMSSFIMGGNKESIYQICKDDDPDGGTIADPEDVLVGWGILINLLTGNIYSELIQYIELKYPGGSLNEAVDDTIIPYFGCYKNGNVRIPHIDEFGSWTFWAESSEINQTLSVLTFGQIQAVRITELELRAALEGQEAWEAWSYSMATDTYAALAIYSRAIITAPAGASVQFFGVDNWEPKLQLGNLISCKNFGEFDIPRDLNNPKAKQHQPIANKDPERLPGIFPDTPKCDPIRIAGEIDKDSGNARRNQHIKNDLNMIYGWIKKYAEEYYGKQFQVRVPFSCAFPDLESLIIFNDVKGDPFYTFNRIETSDVPSNAGGWTEYDNVLGIPIGSQPIRVFKNEEGKVEPFVRYAIFDECGVSKRIDQLSLEDVLVYYELDTTVSNYTMITCDYGAPTGVTTPGIYLNLSTGDIYYEEDRFPPAAMYNLQLGPEWSDVTASTANPTADDSRIRIVPNSNIVRIWNGTTWVQFRFGLYVRATVEEEYKYVDLNTRFSPRVVVTLPQAVTLRRDSSEYLDGMTELIANQVDKCATPANLSKIFRMVGGVNRFVGLSPRACTPDCAAIPIKSNILRYGPWYADGPPGSVKVVRDDSLVPWNFGSFANMNTAGVLIANQTDTNMRYGELGSVDVPGFPCKSLGEELMANTGSSYLLENRTLGTGNFTSSSGVSIDFGIVVFGAWTGSFGPNITNISFSFGAQGPNTNYSMRTFAPRQHFLNKYIQDRLKKTRSEFLALQKRIRAQIKDEIKNRVNNLLGTDNIPRDDGFIANNALAGGGGAGVHEVAFGQNVPFGAEEVAAAPIPSGSGEPAPLSEAEYTYKFCRPVISFQRTEQSVYEMQHDFAEKAAISLDGFFRNISMDGDGGLPQYFQYDEEAAQECETTLYTPDEEDECVIDEEFESCKVVTLDYLNPFSNPETFARSDVVVDMSDTPTVGHDMEMIARTRRDPTDSFATFGFPQDGPEDGLIMPVAGYDLLEQADYRDDYRSMALRGPLLISGWGYDLKGKPIPNKADDPDDAKTGVFTEEDLECKFMDNWMRRCDTWPVAPVDLRLDRKRGVWTSPTILTENNIAIVIPCEGCCSPTLASVGECEQVDENGYPCPQESPIPSGGIPMPSGEEPPPSGQMPIPSGAEPGMLADETFLARIIFPEYRNDSGELFEPLVEVNNTMKIPIKKDICTVFCIIVDCVYYAIHSTQNSLTNSDVHNYDQCEFQILAHEEGGCLTWMDGGCDFIGKIRDDASIFNPSDVLFTVDPQNDYFFDCINGADNLPDPGDNYVLTVKKDSLGDYECHRTNVCELILGQLCASEWIQSAALLPEEKLGVLAIGQFLSGGGPFCYFEPFVSCIPDQGEGIPIPSGDPPPSGAMPIPSGSGGAITMPLPMQQFSLPLISEMQQNQNTIGNIDGPLSRKIARLEKRIEELENGKHVAK